MTLTTALVESLLSVAGSAPSAHNTQPWVSEVTNCTPEGAEVRVGVDPARLLPRGDPLSEDLHLSMGCWLESLAIAAAEAGVHTEPVAVRGRGPTLDIQLSLTTTESSADPTVRGSEATEQTAWPRFRVADLHHRQVDRGPLERSEASFAKATAICRTAIAETGVRLVEVPDRTWRGWLRRAALHSYGDRAVFAETLRWLRFDAGDPLYHQDGLTAECLRISPRGARAAAVLDRPWLHSLITGLASAGLAPVASADSAMRRVARSGHRSRLAGPSHSLNDSLPPASAAAESITAPRPERRHPHHLILSVPERPALSVADEVEVGRTLLRIWLVLDRYGLRVDVHSELKDSPTVRSELAACLHDRPIAAFSVGTSTTPVPRAPRLSPF